MKMTGKLKKDAFITFFILIWILAIDFNSVYLSYLSRPVDNSFTFAKVNSYTLYYEKYNNNNYGLFFYDDAVLYSTA